MAPKKNPQTFDSLPVAGKALLGVLILAFLTGIYYFVLHAPIADELNSAQSQHRRMRNEDLPAARDRVAEFTRITQELATREGLDRANRRVLPQEAEIPAFLRDLHSVAELSGLELRLVEPQAEQPQELFVRIPVQLAVSGRYHQIARFFYNVSRLERAINLENITLHDPVLSDADEVILQVDALATTFRRPAPAEEASP